MPTPEEKARETIDALLAVAGWQLQDRDALTLVAAAITCSSILNSHFAWNWQLPDVVGLVSATVALVFSLTERFLGKIT
ncbi:hypothetical protein ACFLTC_02465 [Chloroflexota bacterium]